MELGTSMDAPDLPAEVLTHILAIISSTRDRNCVSLVCRSWRLCERQTRRHLSLRGHVANLLDVPRCFASISSLDLSHLSWWGDSLLNAGAPPLLTATLSAAFPAVTDVRFYAWDRKVVSLVAGAFPDLESAALVRWHSKGREAADVAPVAELLPLLAACPRLRALDLSSFCCSTGDVPPALAAHPGVAKGLRVLNLLKPSPNVAAFGNRLLKQVAAACPALREFSCVCVFDARFEDCVEDEGLATLGARCTELRALALVNLREHNDPHICVPNSPWIRSNVSIPRRNVTGAGLEGLFRGLPKLEELTLVLNCGLLMFGTATASLERHCPRLRSLHLGRCLIVGEGGVPVGLPACAALQVLGIKYCGGLTDGSLSWICAAYPRLAELELHACPDVTPAGVRHLAEALRSSLTRVALTLCGRGERGMPAKQALPALAPLQPTLEFLHLDWDWGLEVESYIRPGSTWWEAHMGAAPSPPRAGPAQGSSDGAALPGSSEGASTSSAASPPPSTWPRLRQLWLWVPLGLLLRPLGEAGFERCPSLREVAIRVYGNGRHLAVPSAPQAFGLQALMSFPSVERLCVDLSAFWGPSLERSPSKDVACWEAFFMQGIQAAANKDAAPCFRCNTLLVPDELYPRPQPADPNDPPTTIHYIPWRNARDSAVTAIEVGLVPTPSPYAGPPIEGAGLPAAGRRRRRRYRAEHALAPVCRPAGGVPPPPPAARARHRARGRGAGAAALPDAAGRAHLSRLLPGARRDDAPAPLVVPAALCASARRAPCR